MKCVSYTRTIPWKNHKGELTIADQNQRIAEYLAEHKELNLQKRYSDRKNAENAGAAFDKMIDDGVEQKFDCIIVASMYYCGPDFPAARQAIKETLYETGVNLIVLEEGLDTRTASRKEVEDYFEEKRCEMHAEIMFACHRLAFGMRNLHLGLYTPNQGVQKHFDSLFHSTRAATEKKKILEEEFGVAMNGELEREVLVMCNLSQGVKAEGISIGEMRMLVKLVRKGRVTIEEAAKDAGMTVEEFKKVLENTPLGRSL